MTLECQSCAAGLTETEYCARNGQGTNLCPDEPPVCCKAMTLECVSCAEGLTATEYCAKNKDSSLCAKTTTAEPTTTTPRPCPVQDELLCPNNVAPVCGEPTILFPGCELPSCQCPEPPAASTAAGSPDS